MEKRPSLEPFLSLNTEMHTAMSRYISTDRRNRYALTCSDDKTAKLWRLSDGQLLQTFRIPIGNGNEGKLYACALSPDGQTAAVGGWTGYEWENKNSIYLFDTQSGSMIRRISGHPSVITDLEYSPDGRFLVAALAGSDGIRVYRTTDYQVQMEDKDYGGGSYNVAFDNTGRLATVSSDGSIRLYDAQFKLQKKVATTGSKDPFSLAFSPNGNLLAVGYDDSPTVQVLDGQSLRVLYAPNVEGITTDISVLSFSTDGEQLVAGGSYRIDSKNQIRVWQQAGRGAYKDCAVAENAIMDIKPLLNGHFLFGGSQPDWGVLNPVQGTLVLYKSAEVYDLRANDNSHFRLNTSGTEVGFTPLSKSPLQFSIPKRQLTQTQSTHPNYTNERNGIRISDWNDNVVPKLNGRALIVLQQYEQCRSVDIAKGGSAIVLGASWSIYGLNPDGTKRWATPVPAMASVVKIDDSNEVVAAGLSDGTIRWYSMSDGALQLSLFVHPDGRWILWTPSGYYDAAPGAEDLIGWHLNQGADKAALYYKVSQFRSTYYRPDIIDAITESWNEATAIRKAGEKANRSTRNVTIKEELPPSVRLLNPTDGSTVNRNSLEITYTVNSPNDEPITAVRYMVDGRPVATDRGLKPAAQQQATITIPSADCKVSVIVENRFGASEAATVQVRWQGTIAANAVELRPKLYILAIGVGAYTHADVNKLAYSAKDACDFVAVMEKQKNQLYADVQVKLLTDGDANRDNILDALDWLQKQTTHRDVAMLFFAGHGLMDNSGTFYLLPVGGNPTALRRTCLMKAEIKETVANIGGKIIVFIDACHSGNVMKESSTTRRGVPDINGLINELISAENGGVIFSSSTGRQYSLENKDWNNGVFTKALVEGLNGQAVSTDKGRISVKSLDAYIAERVKTLTRGEQTPTTNFPPNVPDFPIAVPQN